MCVDVCVGCLILCVVMGFVVCCACCLRLLLFGDVYGMCFVGGLFCCLLLLVCSCLKLLLFWVA